MKNRIVTGFIAAAFVLGVGSIAPTQARAGVDVNISIPLFGLLGAGVYGGPPAVYAPAPPAYYAPQPVEGAVFYGGFWYRPDGGNWFISAGAGGPWRVIAVERVPYAVVSGPVMMGHRPAYGYGGGGRMVAPRGYGRGWSSYGHRRNDDD